MILALNKWDLVKNDPALIQSLDKSLDRQLEFISFVPTIHISALTGEKVDKLFPWLDKIWEQYNHRVPTAAVNRLLETITEKHPPPYSGKKRPNFLYATQVAVRPPSFTFFVKRPEGIHHTYRRYLINQFKEQFGLHLIPIKIFLREK